MRKVFIPKFHRETPPSFDVHTEFKDGAANFVIAGKEIQGIVFYSRKPSAGILQMANRQDDYAVHCDHNDMSVWFRGRTYYLTVDHLAAYHVKEEGVRPHDKVLKAELPCRVLNVYVKEQDIVQKGQPLLTVESMKMEITLSAPAYGSIEKIYVSPNTLVNTDDAFIELEFIEE